MRRLGAMLTVAAVLAGCATVKTVDDHGGRRVEGGKTPVETVEVSNTCWLLLSFLPIASGDVDNPNGWWCDWFSRTVTLENQMKMLQAEADRAGAKEAVNVTTLTTDEDALLFLFLREKIHTSAVLVK